MLSFVKPPAPRKTRLIGNDQCGVLEVEERGGLTVGESATISELLAEEQSSFVRGAQIADQIAQEESISLAEAFSIVEKSISGQELEEKAEAIRRAVAELARLKKQIADGKTALTGSEDHTARLWETATSRATSASMSPTS